MEDLDSTQRGGTSRADWIRRTISVSAVWLVFMLVICSAPLWLLVTLLVDGATRFRTTFLRSGLLLTLYLTCELIGLAASLVLWLLRAIARKDTAAREKNFQRNFALQCWWAGTLLNGAVRLFRLNIVAEGLEHLDRPMILMLRHTSMADTLLANKFISDPHGIHLRYILKRELLIDPCLDIVGHQLPNYFIDRESDDPEVELAGVRRLLHGLRDHEGVLIYPEGTRFSTEKRNRLLSRLEEKGDTRAADYARSLRHVLPPRLGGALALLEANPGLDVVCCGHVGFERFSRPLELVNGGLMEAQVVVRFWRIPYAELPTSPTDRADWLFEQWRELDEWVATQSPQGKFVENRVPL